MTSHTNTANPEQTFLPKLTDVEKQLLDANNGCRQCRKFHVFHKTAQCPMTTTGTWPDAKTYVPLTSELAASSKPQGARTYAAYAGIEYHDNETDLYVTNPSSFPLMSVPHIYAPFLVTGPSITTFPIPVRALLNIGCPSTVVSDKLATQLGLRHFTLPQEEDNLSSLSDKPMQCYEYVKLELVSDGGRWISGVTRAKVHAGLPVPIILGMPFLSSEQIVIDPHSRTAIDKCTGYNISNVTPSQPCALPWVTPPPTPKKVKPKKSPTLEEVGEPTLAGYLLPGPVMAAVRDHIESIAFQEALHKKDIAMKEKYADRFPLRLPDNIEGVPDHIFHQIWLRNPDKVTCGRGYAAPKKYQASWKKLLDEHLAAGQMRPLSSEYASPAFCVPKYQGGVPDLSVDPRWVNDYRDLNANTIRDNFPLPCVDEILADCGKGKIFRKMDMTNSFFQTCIHPDDIHLTAVCTPLGLYEWTVMLQGGCNAPATHQQRMTDALREHIGKICHVYLDDIIIWSQSVEEHEQNVEAVLLALRKANIYCNAKKSTLFTTELTFLGHLISGAGISADPWKTDKIMNWPQPSTATNVRGFLGLTRYIPIFLPALAEYTSVLSPLTTKECDVCFPEWTDKHQSAFDAIKLLVLGADYLTVIDYDDTDKKIFVTTDASDRRTGAILSFGETWETAHPVAYNSYQLNAAEKNYPVHEKELLAIVKAMKKWRTSLLDHRTLEYFQSQKEMSHRQM